MALSSPGPATAAPLLAMLRPLDDALAPPWALRRSCTVWPVQPDSRRNEVISFVSGGLRDLSISRTSIKWGIPWPDDERHVFYVWYDALTTYMTGVGYGDDELQWEKWWPADLHLIGKEILRFHAVYWPAFLMAAGEPLPKQIFAHGWWLFDTEKMSKSRGNIALPLPVLRVRYDDPQRTWLYLDPSRGAAANATTPAATAPRHTKASRSPPFHCSGAPSASSRSVEKTRTPPVPTAG